MKRPIDGEAGTARAIMWKADEYAKTFDVTEVSKALHRYAGRVHSISCLPKRSAINKLYFAEINHYHGGGRSDMNVALGTGANPISAALDGYRRYRPDDVMWRAFELELQVELLRRAVGQRRAMERRLDGLLDVLADVIARYKVKPDTLFNRMVANMPRTVAELAAANTEDDDL